MRRSSAGESGESEVGSEQPHSGMPAEHALLGLLALSEGGSGHGYDLARQFGSIAPLGNVIRLEPGMVYHHLKKLERLGWVAPLAGEAGRPARRPIALTGAGRTELDRWLAEPVAHTREIRLEFLVKLYFALLLDQHIALRLVDEQREICLRIIDSLSTGRRPAPEGDAGSRERRFGDLVLEMRLAQTEAALSWLDRVSREAGQAISKSGNTAEPP